MDTYDLNEWVQDNEGDGVTKFFKLVFNDGKVVREVGVVELLDWQDDDGYYCQAILLK